MSLKIIPSVLNWESVEIWVWWLVVGWLSGLLLCFLSVCTLECLISFCGEGTLWNVCCFWSLLDILKHWFYLFIYVWMYVGRYVCMKSVGFCMCLVEFVLAFLRFSNRVHCSLGWGGDNACIRSLGRGKGERWSQLMKQWGSQYLSCVERKERPIRRIGRDLSVTFQEEFRRVWGPWKENGEWENLGEREHGKKKKRNPHSLDWQFC